MGTRGRIVLTAWLAACTAAACSLQQGRKGDSCTRSTQCAAGLACIYPDGSGKAKEGKCSSDVSSLNDPSQVPMLMPVDAGMPAVDGGADAAASGDDAGS